MYLFSVDATGTLFFKIAAFIVRGVRWHLQKKQQNKWKGLTFLLKINVKHFTIWNGIILCMLQEYTRTLKMVNSVTIVRVKAKSKIVIIKQFIQFTNKNLVLFTGNEPLHNHNPLMLQKYRYCQLVQVESQR